jgi:hypothetical protein
VNADELSHDDEIKQEAERGIRFLEASASWREQRGHDSKTFDVDRHRRDKLRRLEQRNEYLEAEHARTQTLLADALLFAAGQHCQPLELLQVLADVRGFNLARAAMHDFPPETEEGSARREWTIDELVVLLRETAP